MLAGAQVQAPTAVEELLKVAEDAAALNPLIEKLRRQDNLFQIIVMLLRASTKDEQHKAKVRFVFVAMLNARCIQKDWENLPKFLAEVADREFIIDFMTSVGFSGITLSMLNSLLEWAAKNGELGVAKRILKDHKKDDYSMTSHAFLIAKGYMLTNAFFLAIEHGHVQVLEKLCKHWELWGQDKSMLIAAFMVAVNTGSQEMVACFLAHIPFNDAGRINAATRAYQNGHFQLARFICSQSKLSEELLLQWIVHNVKELFALTGLFSSLKLEQAGVQNPVLSVEETCRLAAGNIDEAGQYFLTQFEQKPSQNEPAVEEPAPAFPKRKVEPQGK